MDIGFFLGVGALLVIFFLIVRFRKRIAGWILGARLPRWILYFLTAIPLIIIEEQINCGKSWCYRVIIPPTLVPLLVFLLLLFIGVKIFRVRSAWKPTIVFGILGVLFEKIFGGLAGVPIISPFLLFMGPYVWLSYAFISLLPLTVLTEER